MHIPPFLVHTALKITSPNGKARPSGQCEDGKAVERHFDDFIGMVPMGQKLFGSLTRCTPGPMQVSIAFAEQHTSGYPWKMNGTVRRGLQSARWPVVWHLSSAELSGQL